MEESQLASSENSAPISNFLNYENWKKNKKQTAAQLIAPETELRSMRRNKVSTVSKFILHKWGIEENLAPVLNFLK